MVTLGHYLISVVCFSRSVSRWRSCAATSSSSSCRRADAERRQPLVVAFSRFRLNRRRNSNYNAQVFVFFIITVAAAEVAARSRIIVALYRAPDDPCRRCQQPEVLISEQSKDRSTDPPGHRHLACRIPGRQALAPASWRPVLRPAAPPMSARYLVFLTAFPAAAAIVLITKSNRSLSSFISVVAFLGSFVCSCVVFVIPNIRAGVNGIYLRPFSMPLELVRRSSARPCSCS